MSEFGKVFCSLCGEFVTPIYGGECPNCGEDIPGYEEDDDEEDE